MNPLTNVKNLQKLNERELELGVAGSKTSWHHQYKDSAWVFVGGLPYDLTEGDVICAFSQYGEIVNINYVRDKATGKPKGFCFICYEDQRSTILTVDNLNGIKLLGRTLKVDHVANYKPPKVDDDVDDITKALREKGCAPLASEDDQQDCATPNNIKKGKKKKKKKGKHEKRKKRKYKSSTSEDSNSSAYISDDKCEKSSRKLVHECNRKRRRDELGDTVSEKQRDFVRNSRIKTEHRDEYIGRDTSQHREGKRDRQIGNKERNSDTGRCDDNQDKEKEGHRRHNDGCVNVRDCRMKSRSQDTHSDSSSDHRAERHRDDRARRDDSSDHRAERHRDDRARRDDSSDHRAEGHRDERARRDDSSDHRAERHRDDRARLDDSSDHRAEGHRDDSSDHRAEGHRDDRARRDDSSDIRAERHRDDRARRDDSSDHRAEGHRDDRARRDDSSDLRAERHRDDRARRDDSSDHRAEVHRDDRARRDDSSDLRAERHRDDRARRDGNKDGRQHKRSH